MPEDFFEGQGQAVQASNQDDFFEGQGQGQVVQTASQDDFFEGQGIDKQSNNQGIDFGGAVKVLSDTLRNAGEKLMAVAQEQARRADPRNWSSDKLRKSMPEADTFEEKAIQDAAVSVRKEQEKGISDIIKAAALGGPGAVAEHIGSKIGQSEIPSFENLPKITQQAVESPLVKGMTEAAMAGPVAPGFTEPLMAPGRAILSPFSDLIKNGAFKIAGATALPFTDPQVFDEIDKSMGNAFLGYTHPGVDIVKITEGPLGDLPALVSSQAGAGGLLSDILDKVRGKKPGTIADSAGTEFLGTQLEFMASPNIIGAFTYPLQVRYRLGSEIFNELGKAIMRKEGVKPVVDEVQFAKWAESKSPGDLRTILKKAKEATTEEVKRPEAPAKQEFTVTPEEQKQLTEGVGSNAEVLRTETQTPPIEKPQVPPTTEQQAGAPQQAPAPAEKVGIVEEQLQDYKGKAYRVETGFKQDKGTTAGDVVNYEQSELGNNLKVPPEIVEMLRQYSSRDIVWVTKKAKDAVRYGKNVKPISIAPGAKIIAEDGNGGYLVLNKSEATKPSVNGIKVYHGTNEDFDAFDLARAKSSSGSQSAGGGIWFTDDKRVAKEFADWSSFGGNKGKPIIKEAIISLKNPKVYESKDGWDSYQKYKFDLEKFKTKKSNHIQVMRSMTDPDTELSSKGHFVGKKLAEISLNMVDDEFDYQGFRDSLIKQGYDGIVLKNSLTDSFGETPSSGYVGDKQPHTQYIAFDPGQIKLSPSQAEGAKTEKPPTKDTDFIPGDIVYDHYNGKKLKYVGKDSNKNFIFKDTQGDGKKITYKAGEPGRRKFLSKQPKEIDFKYDGEDYRLVTVSNVMSINEPSLEIENKTGRFAYDLWKKNKNEKLYDSYDVVKQKRVNEELEPIGDGDLAFQGKDDAITYLENQKNNPEPLMVDTREEPWDLPEEAPTKYQPMDLNEATNIALDDLNKNTEATKMMEVAPGEWRQTGGGPKWGEGLNRKEINAIKKKIESGKELTARQKSLWEKVLVQAEKVRNDFNNQLKELGVLDEQAKSIKARARDLGADEGDIEGISRKFLQAGESEKDIEKVPGAKELGVKLPSSQDASLKESLNKGEIKPALTPDELKHRIEQLNKYGQMQAILRKGARIKKAAGLFVHGKRQPKEGEIRISEESLADPWAYSQVIGHELGHATELAVVGKLNDPRFRLYGEGLDSGTIKTIRRELQAVTKDLVGEAEMKKRATYYNRQTELNARFFEKMVFSPGNLHELAPTVVDLFGKRMIEKPILSEFVEAAKGTIDEGAPKFVLLRDLRQTYQKYLGKRVGDIAYDEEIVYRAMQERGKIVIENFMNEKFKGIKDSQKTLFRAIESIKQSSGGVPDFGSRDFVTAKSLEEIEKLESLGYYKMPLPVMEDGRVYAQYAKSRYTPEESKKLFDSLSEEGKKLAIDFSAEREEAKDYFNREVIKDVNKINSKLEGWVYHYFPEDNPSLLMGGKKFKTKTAGTRKHRTGASGYVEDFKLAMTKALTDLEGERIYNDFITRQFARVTKPIGENADPDPGWIEVVGNVKKGVGTPQEKRSLIIDKTTGKAIPMRQPRYQMPKPIYERYRLWKGLLDEASTEVRLVSDINRYWRVNILAHPGTAMTNFISGGLQYSAKILTDFYTEVLGGEIKLPKTKNNISAMLKVLLPKGWAKSPDWVYGGDLSNFYGQFGKEKGLLGKQIDQYANGVLKLFSTYERYWKKVIMQAEGVSDLKNLGEMTPDGLRLPTQEERELIAEINKQTDLYAYDYDNVPMWLEQHQKSVLGQSIKPFAKWPYKYAKQILDLAGSIFDKTQPPKERLSKLLSLATLVGTYAYFSSERKKRQKTPEVPEGSSVPARYQTRGRMFITEDDQGREVFARTSKYPFWGLTEAGMHFVNGNWEAGKDVVSDMIGSIGPLGTLGMLGLNYRTKYNKYTPTPVIIGDTLSTFVPLSRVLNDLSRSLDPYQRKEETFAQTFTKMIPVTDKDLQEKLHGEIRTEKIPLEGQIADEYGARMGNRTTIDAELKNNWQDIMLSLLSGIYVSRIDPKVVEAYMIRAEENTEKRLAKAEREAIKRENLK